MGDERGTDYYAVLVVSTVSFLAWIAAALGIGYTLYLAVVGRPYRQVVVLTAAAVAVGAGVAMVENRYFDGDLR